jgi:predicted tellurium resistance membrane protein TerC
MMEHFLSPEGLIALFTLTAMEVVLGIDNIVFISIIVAKLPKAEQSKTRTLGLSLALIARLGLLFSISWVMSLTDPLFTLFNFEMSGRNLILLIGGLFLVGKATFEIHEKFELHEDVPQIKTSRGNYAAILIQILLLDIVFSLDSVITAVGMAQQIIIMVTAMVISMFVMLFSAKAIGDFVERHPSIKILALSFLILIGVMLVAEGTGQHMPKAYIYFAMAFSLGVEMLNLKYRSISKKKS